jgi:hypothetical protein
VTGYCAYVTGVSGVYWTINEVVGGCHEVVGHEGDSCANVLGSVLVACSRIRCRPAFEASIGATAQNGRRASLKSLYLRVSEVRRWLIRRWCFNGKGRFVSSSLVVITTMPVLTCFCGALAIFVYELLRHCQ